MRVVFAAVTAVAFTVTGTVGLTQASGHAVREAPAKATKVFTLPISPVDENNPEGVAWDERTKSFFVGKIATGTIYRGTLSDRTLTPFITPDPATAPHSAVGMKVVGGKLFVAGGGTGRIYVYSIKTRALLAKFETGAGGFLNDLVVTPRGDVYVTDSFRPTLWHLTPAMVKARGGEPEAISLGTPIVYQDGFNLNGIVSRRGGRELIVVQSNAQSFFRITIDPKNTKARKIKKIDAPALGGDGLLIDRGRLLVVVGNPAAVHVLKLSNRDLRATSVKVLTDPTTLRQPSTIARAGDRYLVVNADFALDRQPFTVSGLPRGHR